MRRPDDDVGIGKFMTVFGFGQTPDRGIMLVLRYAQGAAGPRTFCRRERNLAGPCPSAPGRTAEFPHIGHPWAVCCTGDLRKDEP